MINQKAKKENHFLLLYGLHFELIVGEADLFTLRCVQLCFFTNHTDSL
ncbi:hypothetical protein D920_00596 [Enterococcus faecalis 13-SD-W-01]|nr:hypothetical protein D920_00596 [Enterococcus faecalis 13-SD-W-01]